MPPPPVAVSREHGTVTLRPSGEIDHETAPALTGAAREAEGEWRRLVVDLSEVSFMDSAGLHALIALEHHCRERGARLDLAGARHQPARLLELVRLAGIFTLAG